MALHAVTRRHLQVNCGVWGYHVARRIRMSGLKQTRSLMLAAGLFVVVTLDAMGDDMDPAILLKAFRQEFVPISPGELDFPREFTMGVDGAAMTEGPTHRVQIKRPFQIARYEVAQNLWQAVMGENPSRWKGPRNSVEMISYEDALAFCRQATDRMRRAKLISDDEVIRLPSEAEWEYAARAGSTGRYSFGDDAEKLGDYAWY